jgi:hypothetical protein
MAGATGGGGLGWGCLKHRPKRDKSHAQQASRGWIGSYGVIAELAQKRFRIAASASATSPQPGVSGGLRGLRKRRLNVLRQLSF